MTRSFLLLEDVVGDGGWCLSLQRWWYSKVHGLQYEYKHDGWRSTKIIEASRHGIYKHLHMEDSLTCQPEICGDILKCQVSLTGDGWSVYCFATPAQRTTMWRWSHCSPDKVPAGSEANRWNKSVKHWLQGRWGSKQKMRTSRGCLQKPPWK